MMYIVRILHSNTNETYKCKNTACHWETDGENIDWGYLDKANGNCDSCINLCDKDESCQSVECGNGYCSWWKNNKCIDPPELHKKTQTCTKTSFLNGRIIYLKIPCHHIP